MSTGDFIFHRCGLVALRLEHDDGNWLISVYESIFGSFVHGDSRQTPWVYTLYRLRLIVCVEVASSMDYCSTRRGPVGVRRQERRH